MIFKYFITFIIINIGIVNSVLAITQNQFIDKILSNPKYLKKEQIDLEVKKLDLKASLSSYVDIDSDLTIELKKSYYDITKDTDSTYTYDKNRKKNSQKISLNLTKNFLTTPLDISFSASRSLPFADITRYKQDEFRDDYQTNTYDNNYKFSLNYPFLKPNSNASSLKTYHKDILDLEKEKLDFIDKKENFITDRLKDFFSIAKYQEKVKIYHKYLQNIKNIKTQNNYDNDKLISEKYLANKDMADNSAKLKASLQDLAIILMDDFYDNMQVDFKYQRKPNFINNHKDYIVKNNRDLLSLIIDKKLKDIDIKYYQKQKLPELDFSVSAEKNTNLGNTRTTIYDNNSIDYGVGLIFTIPLGQDANNDKYLEVSHLSFEKILIDYQDKFKDILADLTSLKTQGEASFRQIKKYPKFIKNTDKDIKIQVDNYNNQIINLKELITTYKDKRDIMLDYVDLAIDYQLNLLKYDDLLDRVISN